jgi:hypothetical protein
MARFEQSTAATEGPAWSSVAAGWVEHWSGFAAPAREAVALATGIGRASRCSMSAAEAGSSASSRPYEGTRVSGIDAAEGLIEFARPRLPPADLRVGPIEQLPWPDDSFDVVSGFNAFQSRPTSSPPSTRHRGCPGAAAGSRSATGGGSRTGKSHAIFEPLSTLKPRQGESDPIGEPGLLEGLARQAGRTPQRADEVEVPYA